MKTRKQNGGLFGFFSSKTKKANRKGPAVSATETELGRVMYVNSEPWIVEGAGKSQRWNKASGYFTHDNGGRPFYVKTRDGKLSVLYGRMDNAAFDNKDMGRIYDKKVLELPKYEKLMIGSNTGKYMYKHSPEGKGNSFLVHVSGDKYVFIGDHVYEFHTKDTIKEFHGIMGNSDVIYAFAVGEENVYFFLDDMYMPKKLMSSDVEDPYRFYFENEKKAKKLKGKMIHKRII
jgi:hypothetical protein